MDLPDDGRGWRAAAASRPVAPSTSYSLAAKVEGLEPDQAARQPAPVKAEPDLQRDAWERHPAAMAAQRQASHRPTSGRGQAVDEAAASLTLLPAPGSRVGSRFPGAGGADARAALMRQPVSGTATHPYSYPVVSADRRPATGAVPLYPSQQLLQQQQQRPASMLWGLPMSAPVMQTLQGDGQALSQAGWGWVGGEAAVPATSQLSQWPAAGGGLSAPPAAPRLQTAAGAPSAAHPAPMSSAANDSVDPLRPTVLIGGAMGGASGDSPRGGSPPPEVMMQHAAALLSLADFLPDGDEAPAQVL